MCLIHNIFWHIDTDWNRWYDNSDSGPNFFEPLALIIDVGEWKSAT